MAAPQPPPQPIRRLTRQIAEVGFALPGSVTVRHMRCGKTNCRCKADPPHLHGPYFSWTRKVAGRTRTRLLTAEQLERYQPWFDNARRLRELLTQLETLSLHAIEEAEGWEAPQSQAKTHPSTRPQP